MKQKVNQNNEFPSRLCWIGKHILIQGGKGVKGPSEQIFIFVFDFFM